LDKYYSLFIFSPMRNVAAKGRVMKALFLITAFESGFTGFSGLQCTSLFWV